jgi:hypothetical protein
MRETKSYVNITNKNNFIKTIHGIFNINLLDNRYAVGTEYSIIDKNLYLIVPCGNLTKNPTVNLNKNLNSSELRTEASRGGKTFCVKKKTKWIFKKFKYHGKGYKVKKVNTLSKITFRLGRSH